MILAATSALAQAQDQRRLPAQSRAAFSAALRDTAPEFVAVTVVNDNSGQTISGCIPAGIFLGAMHTEYGLGHDADADGRVMAAALASAGRIFHFRNDEAWAEMPANVWSARACAIIASGQVARVAAPSRTSMR